jgi:hypothetical protein
LFACVFGLLQPVEWWLFHKIETALSLMIVAVNFTVALCCILLCGRLMHYRAALIFEDENIFASTFSKQFPFALIIYLLSWVLHHFLHLPGIHFVLLNSTGFTIIAIEMIVDKTRITRKKMRKFKRAEVMALIELEPYWPFKVDRNILDTIEQH